MENLYSEKKNQTNEKTEFDLIPKENNQLQMLPLIAESKIRLILVKSIDKLDTEILSVEGKFGGLKNNLIFYLSNFLSIKGQFVLIKLNANYKNSIVKKNTALGMFLRYKQQYENLPDVPQMSEILLNKKEMDLQFSKFAASVLSEEIETLKHAFAYYVCSLFESNWVRIKDLDHENFEYLATIVKFDFCPITILEINFTGKLIIVRISEVTQLLNLNDIVRSWKCLKKIEILNFRYDESEFQTILDLTSKNPSFEKLDLSIDYSEGLELENFEFYSKFFLNSFDKKLILRNKPRKIEIRRKNMNYEIVLSGKLPKNDSFVDNLMTWPSLQSLKIHTPHHYFKCIFNLLLLKIAHGGKDQNYQDLTSLTLSCAIGVSLFLMMIISYNRKITKLELNIEKYEPSVFMALKENTSLTDLTLKNINFKDFDSLLEVLCSDKIKFKHVDITDNSILPSDRIEDLKTDLTKSRLNRNIESILISQPEHVEKYISQELVKKEIYCKENLQNIIN